MFCYGSNKKTTSKHCSSLALLGHNTLWSLADIYWTWEPWVPDQHGHLDSGVWESRKIQKPRKQTNKKQKQKNNKEQKKGCYRRLVEYASPEGKFEALHMINENYFAVDEALQEMQRAFLELHPECLAENAPGENAPESSEAMAEWGFLGTACLLEDFLWFLMIFFDF